MEYDAAEYDAHFSKFEEDINHFYLDTKGIITIGRGCQVFNPRTLNMIHKTDLRTASPDEIQQEFTGIQTLEPGHYAVYYDRYCKLVMTDQELQRLFNYRLQMTFRELAAKLGDFTAQYPPAAILALIDMAFNMGVARLFFKFPNFIAAFRKMDWAACAKECEREGHGMEERNKWTRTQFENLIS